MVWSQDDAFLYCFGLLDNDSNAAWFKLHKELQLAATKLQYQLSLINKAYTCMARKLVILAISYPRQISQPAVSTLPIHTAEKDITFICFNVLCHPL